MDSNPTTIYENLRSTKTTKQYCLTRANMAQKRFKIHRYCVSAQSTRKTENVEITYYVLTEN